MSLPEIRELARQIERSSPSDTRQQAAILGRLRELSRTMKGHEEQDLSGCMDAAALLTEYLTHMGGIGPDGILRVVLRLVNVVRDALEEEGRQPAQTATAPAAATPPAPATTTTSATPPAGGARRGWIPLSLRDQESTLRMVSDLVLGEVLVQLGYSRPEQVDRALQVQRATGQRIGEALVEVGAVNWSQIEHALRVQDHLRRGFGTDVRSVG